MANAADILGRKVNHSTRKTFATTLLHSDRPTTEVAQFGGWKGISTLTHYNVPSVKQQDKASNILSEVIIPEINSDVDISEPKLETEPNLVETVGKENCSVVPVTTNSVVTLLPNTECDMLTSQSVLSSSTSSSSNMIATRKDSNPFSLFCGATISGGVINLNIFSGKRKHIESESLPSSQE